MAITRATIMVVNSITPSQVTAGAAASPIVVIGANFVSVNTVIEIDGTAIDSTFISTTEFHGTVPASMIVNPDVLQVGVHRTGETPSNTVPLTVSSPIPWISETNPTELPIGIDRTVFIFGTGFMADCKVQWNDASHEITPQTVTSGTIKFLVPASYATWGTHHIYVANPGPVVSSPHPIYVANPTPTIASLTPGTVLPGAAQFSLVIAGGGFATTSGNLALAYWDGTALTITARSATSITATIPASYVVASGSHTIKVSNPGTPPSGATKYSNSLTFYVGAPSSAPTITALAPSSAIVGGSGFTLTVTGTNYQTTSIVRWAGADRPTSRSSATVLTAQITAADIVAAVPSPGIPVTVYTPPPGGGESVARGFPVASTNPTDPTITSLDPPSIAMGASVDFALDVYGTNFAGLSLVQWNGANLVTSVANSTLATATVPFLLVAAESVARIAVVNPPPGGGTSAVVDFNVMGAGENQIPVLTSISPTYTTAGHAQFALTVQGTGFVSGAQVLWNGTPLTTTFSNSSLLSATIAASYVASVGVASVAVRNPLPGGGDSTTLPFSINSATANPAPVIASLSPSSIDRGSAATTLNVYGSQFAPPSVVTWAGANRATSYIHSGMLQTLITSSDLTELTGVVVRMNPAAHQVSESASARSIRSTGMGDVQRPSMAIGDGVGFYRPAGTTGSLAVAAGGIDVGRFDGSAGEVGFGTPEALRVPPWIEPEVVCTVATTVSSTSATDITGTAKTIVPGRSVRVQVVATFDATMTVAGSGFIGELWVNGVVRPERAVYYPDAVNERATVFQCWNFALLGGATAALKLTGRVATTGTYSVGTQTKWSLIGVGRY